MRGILPERPNPALQRTRHTAAAPLSVVRVPGMSGCSAVQVRSPGTGGRRRREAPGHGREAMAKGRVERRRGATNRHPLRGVTRLGRGGTAPRSPPRMHGRGRLNGRRCAEGAKADPGSAAGWPGHGRREEQASWTAPQRSAAGIVGACPRADGLHGRAAAALAVAWRNGLRRGVGRGRGLG